MAACCHSFRNVSCFASSIVNRCLRSTGSFLAISSWHMAINEGSAKEVSAVIDKSIGWSLPICCDQPRRSNSWRPIWIIFVVSGTRERGSRVARSVTVREWYKSRMSKPRMTSAVSISSSCRGVNTVPPPPDRSNGWVLGKLNLLPTSITGRARSSASSISEPTALGFLPR